VRKRTLAAAALAALAARQAVARWRSAELAGEVALVTGGSRGLGFLVARELLRQGCRVAICARSEDELAAAQRELASVGEVLAFRCDVAAPREVERMVAEVERMLGPVGVLVNNAGVIQVGPLESQTPDDYRAAMQVMYWGTVHCTLAVLPGMLARGRGRIANVTSIGGKVAVPHLLPYASAKFAAVGFSEGLRAELAPTGVAVSTIVPGLMRTGSYLNAYFKGRQDSEYRLFALLANAPVVSMDAERAARQVVGALREGRPERVLGLPAALAVRAHGAFPGLSARVLGLASRLLPRAEGPTPLRRGLELQEEGEPRLFDAATALGREAARRLQRIDLA
jgi:NAD(P)-dependent dehydrogenase (short-subunit alcohol dehydrogenase family)